MYKKINDLDDQVVRVAHRHAVWHPDGLDLGRSTHAAVIAQLDKLRRSKAHLPLDFGLQAHNCLRVVVDEDVGGEKPGDQHENGLGHFKTEQQEKSGKEQTRTAQHKHNKCEGESGLPDTVFVTFASASGKF